MEDEEMLLTVEEQALILGCIGPDATQGQIDEIFKWAKMARLNEALLRLLLLGCVEVTWSDSTDEPMFKISDFGKEVYSAR